MSQTPQLSRAEGLQGPESGRQPGLGRYAKSATPPSVRAKLRIQRLQRFELLSAARDLFVWKGLQTGLEYGQNWHRTAKCQYVPHGSDVGINVSCEHNSAFFTGLISCGSVWACPICAVKIQERRRQEIAAAIDWAYKHGLQPVMVTLTFPHYQWQQLSDLIAQQTDALHRLRAGNPWTKFKQRMGYRGLIRSLELTYGENGWHPHTHELWFLKRDADAEDMKVKILERWEKCCARAGLLDPENAAQVEAFRAHAVDVKGNCSASDYMAKQDDSRHWGADREIAKGSTKAGRAKGKHPFRLLAMAYQDGDKQAGARFIEYAQVMKGRRQLFWSHGFKALVGIEDRTDEELVEEERDSADCLGLVANRHWKLIRAAKMRAQVLNAAETEGWPGVLEIIRDLEKAQPTEPIDPASQELRTWLSPSSSRHHVQRSG